MRTEKLSSLIHFVGKQAVSPGPTSHFSVKYTIFQSPQGSGGIVDIEAAFKPRGATLDDSAPEVALLRDRRGGYYQGVDRERSMASK